MSKASKARKAQENIVDTLAHVDTLASPAAPATPATQDAMRFISAWALLTPFTAAGRQVYGSKGTSGRVTLHSTQLAMLSTGAVARLHGTSTRTHDCERLRAHCYSTYTADGRKVPGDIVVAYALCGGKATPAETLQCEPWAYDAALPPQSLTVYTPVDVAGSKVGIAPAPATVHTPTPGSMAVSAALQAAVAAEKASA